MHLLADPLQRLVERLGTAADRRHIIGLVGLPGSGKSTLAARLVAELNLRQGAGTAMALGMDGFHLTRAILAGMPDPAAALERRGAPWTFDPLALADRLRTLRAMPVRQPLDGDGAGLPTFWPAFEHGVGDPVADAITIGPEVRLVLVEGLYLLHAGHGWGVADLLDECWYLDVDLATALGRLTRRHMATWGLSLAQAQARVDANDRLNAGIVLASRPGANWLVDGRFAGASERPPGPD